MDRTPPDLPCPAGPPAHEKRIVGQVAECVPALMTSHPVRKAHFGVGGLGAEADFFLRGGGLTNQ